MSAMAWCRDEQYLDQKNLIEDNLFYRMWTQVDFEDLLIDKEFGTIDNQNKTSLFSRQKLEKLSEDLMEKREHAVVLEALEDVMALRVSADATREWLDEHPEFNKNFLPYLGKRMRYLEESAADLALHDTITRLSKLILRNVDDENPSNSNNNAHSVSLINDLSNDNIAKMIGSVRAVVNRSIQVLKSNKIIETSRKEKSVKNLKELIKRCEHALFYSGK